MMTSYSIDVRGIPAPQGSKKIVRAGGKATGRPIMVEDSKAVAPWREAIRSETQRAVPARFDGPVFVNMMIKLPRSKSRPKTELYPNIRPDLDKLVRAVLDGLTMGAAWHDDSQVVMILASKVYDPIPGCAIVITDSLQELAKLLNTDEGE